jgi:hypothetical protein
MKHRIEERRNGEVAKRQRPVARFIPVALAMLLFACGTADRVDNIERADIGRTAATKPVVVGRLHIRSAGGILLVPDHSQWSNVNPKSGPSVGLVRVAPDAKAFGTQVRTDGRFAWGLDPGIYVIEWVRGLARPLKFNYAFCTKTVFRVARRSGIVNLGEIAIKFPTDPAQRFWTPGFFDATSCAAPEIRISVTQEAGEITRIVLHPMTRAAVAPQLPQLWEPREKGNIDRSNIPKARAVLRNIGIESSDLLPPGR